MERRTRRTSAEWPAQLHLSGGVLPVTIRRSGRARRLRLVVDPRRATIVTVPARAARTRTEAERLAERFTAEREEWLRHHLERLARGRSALAGDGAIGEGRLIRYRGELHALRVTRDAATRRTTVTREGLESGDEIVVRLAPAERRAVSSILERWLRDRARTAIEHDIRAHAPPLGVTVRSITIRDQRTRWGSCSRHGTLSFSWRLILAPPEALETVVIHELCHLRVFGHGASFWQLVASLRPDHARWRRWLREHSPELHAMLDRDLGTGPEADLDAADAALDEADAAFEARG